MNQTNPKSILIIDDDQELTDLLCEYLQPHGYQITLAHDGESGLQLATGSQSFDLIILDVMLPKLDGFEVLKRLRLTHITPVLMLTAKGDDFDRIFGLELGADDYLAKPFNPRELSARVKAIVRRVYLLSATNPHSDICIEDVTLVPANRSVFCADSAVEMTSTEFSVLHILMMHVGELVTKKDISMNVLGRPLAAFDRSIDMHVSNIRKKLNLVREANRIKTIRGEGYLYVRNSVG